MTIEFLNSDIETFSFSGTITEDGVFGDWTIVKNGLDLESFGELSLRNLAEFEGVKITLEEGETFRGEFVY